MADIAALNLAVKSDQVKQATVELKEMGKAATASERAAEKWGMATKAAARSADDFSKRVQGTIKSLDFETAQLKRSASERAKYAALKRAGVAEASAEGRAIIASVAALQAQRAAIKSASEAHKEGSAAAKAGAAVYGSLKTTVLGLAAAFSIGAIIDKVTSSLREAADLAEAADQIGITVEGLQSLQFQAVQGGVSLEQLNTAVGKFSDNIGKAAEGDKAMIESLQNLGVKILDVKGNLLPTQDILVAVAQKITAIDDPARKVAAAVEFFGKAGKALIPMLAEISKGFGVMSADAKKAGAMISAEAIAKLDAMADSAAKSHLVLRALFAENAAGPLTTVLETITDAVGKLSQALIGARSNLSTLLLLALNPTTALAPIIASTLGNTPSEALAKNIADQRSKIEQAQTDLVKNAGNSRAQAAINKELTGAQAALAALERQQQVAAVSGKQTAPANDPDNMGILGTPPKPKGVLNPTPKASGGGGGSKSDPYKSAIEGAREYVLAKNAETAAVGLSVSAAKRMWHEQGLLNKVQTDGKVATAAQKAEIAGLAQAMADADAKFAHASFMDEFKTSTDAAIASQQIEYDTLWMATEAAMAYRIEQEAVNDAVAKGIELGPVDIALIREKAAAQAKLTQKVQDTKDEIEFAKDIAKGFFSDMRSGLQEGQSLWETFGSAISNIIDKISAKLLDVAVDMAFGGSGGSIGQTIFKLVGGAIGGAAGGSIGGTGVGSVSDFGWGTSGLANGAALRGGNVIPFAHGGVVNRPTLFPMARGMGLMGEAGPEVVMPLRRGPGGRLGVSMHSGGGGTQRVEIHLVDAMLDARIAEGSNVEITRREPATVGKAVRQSTRLAPAAVAQRSERREGEWRLAGA